MKYAIPILTLLLFLYGLLIIFSALLVTGIGFYTPLLTFATIIGLVVTLADKRIGKTILLVVSIGWLLKCFEAVSYLFLYDLNSTGRWILTIVPLLLAFSIFSLTLRELLINRLLSLKLWYLGVALCVFLSIGLFSFIWKPHTEEFNCWYHFDKNSDNYIITFAITPDHKFEAITNSVELKEVVLKDGITYEFRDGYYCPETEVQVITRFKQVVGIKILGFRNTEINKLVRLQNPIEIDIETIKGDKSILQPEFSWGDYK